MSFCLYNCIQNKTSPNIGILLKGALIDKLLNNCFASCFLINLDFSLLHTAHFDNIIVSPFLVFEISGVIGFVFSTFALYTIRQHYFYTLFFHRFSMELY